MNNKQKNRVVSVILLFLPEIKELLAQRKFAELKGILPKIHIMDIAEGWKLFSASEKILLFKLLKIKRAIELFESLRLEEQSFLLHNLENEEVSRVLNEMDPAERADLFKDLPQKVIKKFFNLMKKEEVDNVQRLMTYKENTAGALMTTDFIELKKELTLRQAIVYIQERLNLEFQAEVHTAYITDAEHKLIGAVEFQDILKYPADMLIKDMMASSDYIKISVATSQQEVAARFQKYDLHSAPVVDENNRLLGVINIEDIVDLIEKEATKDLYGVGKMTAEGGEVISYQRCGPYDLIKRRVGWLILLLVFDFLTAEVLKNYSHSLELVIALSFFIPMILDTGGNAGAQTSITIIRGLATGDVHWKNVWRIIKLEGFSAMIMGLAVGGFAFFRATLSQSDLMVSFVVGLTMFSVVLLAIATGICLPLLSKKVGLDPAVLAGPITTSIVDVVGLIIYFKIAQVLLPVLR